MLKENKTEDKSCLFYVSDYHFEMIALPYMKEKSVEEISEIDTLNNKVVFVKGTEKYIKNVNQKINEVSNVQNLQVIDCYDVNNVDESIIDITKDYNSILSTSGLKNL